MSYVKIRSQKPLGADHLPYIRSMVRPYKAFFKGYQNTINGNTDVFARPRGNQRWLRAFDAGCEAASQDLQKREQYRRNELSLKDALGEHYPGSSVVPAGSAFIERS